MEKFRLANALGDHMVLQRDVPVRLWGKGAAEGDVIYAVLGPYEAWGQVDETLTWELVFAADACKYCAAEASAFRRNGSNHRRRCFDWGCLGH